MVLGNPCSDRCEGEGNVSEGLWNTRVAHILELGTTGAASAGFHGKLQELEQILKLESFSLILQIELVIFYEKRKQKQMCWSSVEVQIFGFSPS